MAWEIQFPDGQQHLCAAVEYLTRVDEVAHLLVYPDEPDRLPRDASIRGSTFELGKDRERIKLTVVGRVIGRSGPAIRAVLGGMQEQDPPAVPASLLVHQRRRTESLMSFADRVSEPRQFEEIGDRESIDDLSDAIPVGACVLGFDGEPAALRSARAIAAIVEGSTTAMGQARALSDSKWRLLSFNRQGDADRLHVLNEAWTLDAPGAATSIADCAVVASRHVAEQWSALQLLQQSADVIAELGDGFAVPVLPMSVNWAGESFFAAEISVLFLNPGREMMLDSQGQVQTNVELRMVLQQSARPTRAGGGLCQGAVVLLGRVQGKPPDNDAIQLLEVGPAAATDAEGVELKALTDWQSGDGSPLQVVQPMPGFARKDISAFYARWALNDLILVHVAPRSIPIGLGAPRRDVAEFEAGGVAEVAIRGKGVMQRAEGDAPTSMLLQPDGTMTVDAPTRLTLAVAVSVTPDLVSIERNTKVTGELDVD